VCVVEVTIRVLNAATIDSFLVLGTADVLPDHESLFAIDTHNYSMLFQFHLSSLLKNPHFLFGMSGAETAQLA
jgi:hypothetical protein